MATVEDAANWIAFESEDYDGLGGANGYGWGRATTDEVAAGIGVATVDAYRLLKAAARKGLVSQDKERRKGVTTKRFGSSQVGWAIWEVHLDAPQDLVRSGVERAPGKWAISAARHPSLDEVARGDRVTGKTLLLAAEAAGVSVDRELARKLNRPATWAQAGFSNVPGGELLYREVRDRHGVVLLPNPSRAEAEARDARDLARRRIGWTSDHPDARAYRQRYGLTNTLPVCNDWDLLSEEEQEGRRFGMDPNASYYVWVVAPHSDTPLSSEGPYGPHPLRIAEQMARIGATEGVHDRAVSLGRDPEAHGFRIERRYQARSGKRLV
jgi:hypothetical protein